MAGVTFCRCAGVLSSCGELGLLSSGAARSSRRGGFSHYGVQVLGVRASVIAARQLSSHDARA